MQSMRKIAICWFRLLLTNHHYDEDVANEAGDKDDGECDGDEEERESSDHVLILLIEVDNLAGVVLVHTNLL